MGEKNDLPYTQGKMLTYDAAVMRFESCSKPVPRGLAGSSWPEPRESCSPPSPPAIPLQSSNPTLFHTKIQREPASYGLLCRVFRDTSV